MQSILDAISQVGSDPHDAEVVGVMRHIPAGSRDHWAGEPVSVFKPAATEVRIRDRNTGTTLLAFDCAGDDLTDEAAFWSTIVTPQAIPAVDAARLAQSLVEFHRDLTGEIHRTHEVIETDPFEIAKIGSARTELTIDLMHLVNFVLKDDALFDAMFSMTTGENVQTSKSSIRYERDSLLAKFVKTPCDRALYDELREEYAQGDYLGGVVFQDYYGWFRKSEAKFSSEQGIPQETRDLVRQAMTAWLSVGDPPTEDWMRSKEKLFMRNFEVHPRHREVVAAFLRETLQSLQPEIDSKVSRGAKP